MRMCGIVGEQAKAGIGDGADGALLNYSARVLDSGHITVVEADRALHPRGSDGLGVCSQHPDRFFDPQVLARPGDGLADLAVQEVRGGHAHGLDPVVGEDVFTSGRCCW